MPFYYKGQVVTKDVWDKISPELKKRIVMEGSTRMTGNINGIYVQQDQTSIDKETGRLYALLRIDLEKQSLFYAHVSCKSFDLKNVEPKDFKIEFLNNVDWNTKHVPYDKELFKGIYDTASEEFLMLAENEALKSSAV